MTFRRLKNTISVFLGVIKKSRCCSVFCFSLYLWKRSREKREERERKEREKREGKRERRDLLLGVFFLFFSRKEEREMKARWIDETSKLPGEVEQGNLGDVFYSCHLPDCDSVPVQLKISNFRIWTLGSVQVFPSFHSLFFFSWDIFLVRLIIGFSIFKNRCRFIWRVWQNMKSTREDLQIL